MGVWTGASPRGPRGEGNGQPRAYVPIGGQRGEGGASPLSSSPGGTGTWSQVRWGRRGGRGEGGPGAERGPRGAAAPAVRWCRSPAPTPCPRGLGRRVPALPLCQGWRARRGHMACCRFCFDSGRDVCACPRGRGLWGLLCPPAWPLAGPRCLRAPGWGGPRARPRSRGWRGPTGPTRARPGAPASGSRVSPGGLLRRHCPPLPLPRTVASLCAAGEGAERRKELLFQITK